MGLEYYKDQWIPNGFVIVHLRDVWINFNWSNRGEKHWVRKIALQKRGWTALPTRNVFVSVFTQGNKEIIKNVSNSTGIVNSFSTF